MPTTRLPGKSAGVVNVALSPTVRVYRVPAPEVAAALSGLPSSAHVPVNAHCADEPGVGSTSKTAAAQKRARIVRSAFWNGRNLAAPSAPRSLSPKWQLTSCEAGLYGADAAGWLGMPGRMT